MSEHASPSLESLDLWVEDALKQGARHADVFCVRTHRRSVTVRLSAIDAIEHASLCPLGLRVFMDGGRQGFVSTTDARASQRKDIVAHAIAMATHAPEEPCHGLIPSSALPRYDDESLDMMDSVEPNDIALEHKARSMEEGALSVKGITNSEGCQAQWACHDTMVVASNGLRARYRHSVHGIMLSVLAGTGTHRERDYDYQQCLHGDELGDLHARGQETAHRAIARLNPRKIESAPMPVVYDPRIASTLLQHIADALNGDMLARGTSFLKESKGKTIMPETIDIIDDPLRPRGLFSRPWDAEGTKSQTTHLVKKGRVHSYILDRRAACLMQETSTGHAYRTPDSLPTPRTSNLFMANGTHTPQELLSGIKRGFYATELLGLSLNINTGDYSRGAAGFMIEDGERTYPVSEVTIAGNLNHMYQQLTPANDLTFFYGIDAPTCLIDHMMVGGK
ncbi:MAG: TldD/PmbA family protein [Alphaproteobacteria bacterium GM7ARS4]|nr:TldD/PmbA family protein [Alphaproteobacteria bacterium GM7ARS4]